MGQQAPVCGEAKFFRLCRTEGKRIMSIAKCLGGAIAALVLASLPAVAAGKAEGNAGIDAAPHLCAAGETAALACRTKDDRLIAVCASGKGLLRLVIRQTGKADVALPKAAPAGAVSTGWIAYSGGGGTYARFKAGKLDYVAYSGIGRGWEQAGLSEVEVRATDDAEASHVAEHVCLPAGHRYDAGFPLLAEKAGLPIDETPTFDIPVEN